MQRLKPNKNLWEQIRVQNQETQPTQIYLRVQFLAQATDHTVGLKSSSSTIAPTLVSNIGKSLFTLFASLTYAYHYLMMLIK